MILRSCAGWCAVTHRCWVISRRRSSWPNQAALPYCTILLLYVVVKIAHCLFSMLLGSSIRSSANNYFGFESYEFYCCYFSFHVPLGCVYNAGCELQINAVLHTWAMLDILSFSVLFSLGCAIFPTNWNTIPKHNMFILDRWQVFFNQLLLNFSYKTTFALQTSSVVILHSLSHKCCTVKRRIASHLSVKPSC